MHKNIGYTVMNAAKATLKNLKAKFSLPFSEILPDEWLHEVSKEVKYRNRFFTPSVQQLSVNAKSNNTNHCKVFLSDFQVINSPK
jgi:hypothetical protein